MPSTRPASRRRRSSCLRSPPGGSPVRLLLPSRDRAAGSSPPASSVSFCFSPQPWPFGFRSRAWRLEVGRRPMSSHLSRRRSRLYRPRWRAPEVGFHLMQLPPSLPPPSESRPRLRPSLSRRRPWRRRPRRLPAPRGQPPRRLLLRPRLLRRPHRVPPPPTLQPPRRSCRCRPCLYQLCPDDHLQRLWVRPLEDGIRQSAVRWADGDFA